MLRENLHLENQCLILICTSRMLKYERGSRGPTRAMQETFYPLGLAAQPKHIRQYQQG